MFGLESKNLFLETLSKDEMYITMELHKTLEGTFYNTTSVLFKGIKASSLL